MILKDDKLGNNAVFFYQDPDPDQAHNDKITRYSTFTMTSPSSNVSLIYVRNGSFCALNPKRCCICNVFEWNIVLPMLPNWPGLKVYLQEKQSRQTVVLLYLDLMLNLVVKCLHQTDEEAFVLCLPGICGCECNL